MCGKILEVTRPFFNDAGLDQALVGPMQRQALHTSTPPEKAWDFPRAEFVAPSPRRVAQGEPGWSFILPHRGATSALNVEVTGRGRPAMGLDLLLPFFARGFFRPWPQSISREGMRRFRPVNEIPQKGRGSAGSSRFFAKSSPAMSRGDMSDVRYVWRRFSSEANHPVTSCMEKSQGPFKVELPAGRFFFRARLQ